MVKQKFTAILVPDGDGYQVIIPHYPECVTWGETPSEAFNNAKEAMESLLEHYAEECEGDTVIPNVHAAHVVVGDIEVNVPESLIEKPEKATVGAKPRQ